jgi:hypothetical protein
MLDVPSMEGLGGCWFNARLPAELWQPVTDGVPRRLVTHEVVRLWLQRQRTLDDARRDTKYFRVTLICSEDMRATHLAEVPHDVGRYVERNQALRSGKMDGLLWQADPSGECRAAETPTLAAVAMDNTLCGRLGAKRHRTAVAAS